MKTILLILLISFQIFNAQKREFKCEKVYDAVELIDQSKFDEAINILKECEKIDPSDYTYPYEIAYALLQKKDYKNAISQLEKIKSYSTIQADYYQLLGNTYDYDNNPKKAIATYDEGLKKFPNSGRLHLEKGVMYEYEQPEEAIKIYEKGIRVDPTYPSNYYRVSNLYLKSDNKLPGLIYGEIFVNLERTTKRTQEMSEKLYKTYKNAIDIKDEKSSTISLCKVISVDVNSLNKNKVPFCMMFEASMMLSSLGEKEFTYESFTKIRKNFLKEYSTRIKKSYPNVLMDYFKKMEDQKVFDAYNHYVFQIGDEQAFAAWKEKNEEEYQKFADWYTKDENKLKIDKTNLYIVE
ncbi:tetratricopeptide repeat protein [Chryseobacterium sp. APV1]|uniref:Tetratricopeptide repeat protein n=1 Tax=Chryseobacterium urinae TaxID=3058400 RepID=A0ABT8U229_9FLAO|nr:tetratricopeptide repeat protein [Chryseobacterium sp. APV1]MDO3425112.1 tetratricopeptide repeat protein [Chryseobacterium sp. APV1]